jgi:ketosteroid isomerase-like protein
MSSYNVEVVRGAYRVFDSDLDALLRVLDPAIEWVSPSDAIEPGVRTGHDGVRSAYAATAMAWEDTSHVPEAFRDSEDKVLATVAFRAHGRGSGMDAERTEFHVWTLRDGVVTRFEWYYGREQALAAAGLAHDQSPSQNAYSDS